MPGFPPIWEPMDGSQKQSSQYGAALDAVQMITFVLNTHSFKCQHWWGRYISRKKWKINTQQLKTIKSVQALFRDIWSNVKKLQINYPFYKMVIVLLSHQKKICNLFGIKQNSINVKYVITSLCLLEACN